MAQLLFSSKNVNYEVFVNEFMRNARDGFIGDPMGDDSYGYLRVSTDGQTKEEKNGVPRQIENLHKAALRDHVRISWDWIYGDDESGYLIERPALQELMTTTQRDGRIKHLTFESIGRMSREWEWQQGWLLHQFEDLRRMTVHFFDEVGNPLMRMIDGYMYGESMKRQKALMSDGRTRKARDKNCVSGSKPAFGFRTGAKKGYDPEKIREFTTWYIRQPEPNSPSGCTQYGEALIVLEIFETLAYEGLTTYALCERLQEKYGAPKNYIRWFPAFINDIVHNPAYYGKFAANRFWFEIVEKLEDDGKVTRKKVRHEREEKEWILVDVEPIVTREVWDLANRAMSQNKKMSPRNRTKFPSLLIGLLKCEHCGYAWNAENLKQTIKGVSYFRQYYACSSKRGSNRFQETDCPTAHYIRQEIIDAIVWDAVRKVIFHPEVLIEYIEKQGESEANIQVRSQIDYINNQIERRKMTDQRDRDLYDNGYMEMSEYGPKHKETAAQITRWQASIEDLKRKLVTAADIEAKKNRVLALAGKAKRFENVGGEAPFELKQNLIKMCVDAVYIDEPNGLIRILGEIGDYTRSLDEFQVVDNRNGGQNDATDGRIVNGYSTLTSSRSL
jgi:site-specific DNA recombinase